MFADDISQGSPEGPHPQGTQVSEKTFRRTQEERKGTKMTEFGEELIKAMREAVAHAEGKGNIRGKFQAGLFDRL